VAKRLKIVKRHLDDVKLSTITRETIEHFQAMRRLEGASNRTINMDVGALRKVLKRPDGVPRVVERRPGRAAGSRKAQDAYSALRMLAFRA
jgi:hypothetical protein